MVCAYVALADILRTNGVVSGKTFVIMANATFVIEYGNMMRQERKRFENKLANEHDSHKFRVIPFLSVNTLS